MNSTKMDKLRDKMYHHRVSQEKLGEAAGLSQGQMSKIFSGRKKLRTGARRKIIAAYPWTKNLLPPAVD